MTDINHLKWWIDRRIGFLRGRPDSNGYKTGTITALLDVRHYLEGLSPIEVMGLEEWARGAPTFPHPTLPKSIAIHLAVGRGSMERCALLGNMALARGWRSAVEVAGCGVRWCMPQDDIVWRAGLFWRGKPVVRVGWE